MASHPRTPPVGHIGIAGLGLIGGSVALGVRAAWPAVRLTGVDRPEVLERAIALGAIDTGADSVAAFRTCDLVLLAAPIPGILTLIDETARAGIDAVVTDVGSTKRQILHAAKAAGLRRFVGGHPVAGAELGGLEYARADLFAGRPWVIVDESDDRDAVAVVESLAGALGATPHATDAVAHDRTMAYVSHVPQLVADALMSAAGNACGRSGLGLAGPAFRDMTRISSSPPDLWQGIFSTNADFVTEALRALQAELPEGSAIGDRRGIDRLFGNAHRWRRELNEVSLPRA